VISAFSLLGYLFRAEQFYSIHWLTAIAMPTGTMLLAVAVGLIFSVPERDPLRLLLERSGAGTLARYSVPAMIIVIPLVLWLRILGYEYGHYDLGTGRALGALALMGSAITIVWIALLKLRRHDQELQDAARRKDEFLAMLAHELRNPLAPIRTGLELLTAFRDNPTGIDEVVGMMTRQMKQLVTLVDDLMEVSRISRGKFELRMARVRLVDIIQSAVEASQPLIVDAKHA
jgi:signal transduction histidine kinase